VISGVMARNDEQYNMRNDPELWLVGYPPDFNVHYDGEGSSSMRSEKKFKKGDFIINVGGTCLLYDPIADPLRDPALPIPRVPVVVEILFRNEGTVWIVRANSWPTNYMELSDDNLVANCNARVFQHYVPATDGTNSQFVSIYLAIFASQDIEIGTYF
jgi:hypothetical protein